jgi:hypothetical protein
MAREIRKIQTKQYFRAIFCKNPIRIDARTAVIAFTEIRKALLPRSIGLFYENLACHAKQITVLLNKAVQTNATNNKLWHCPGKNLIAQQ